MFKFNKVKYTILICTVLVISFFSSYLIFSKASNKDKFNTNTLNNTSSVNAYNLANKETLNDETVNKDTKIIFKVEYKKSGEIFNEKVNDNVSSLVGKTKKDIEGIYAVKGYIIKEMDSNHLVLLKSFDRYSPQKYVIDIYKVGNCVAIFKTDGEGKESIEDPDKDIKFDTKLSDIKEGDLDTMLVGRKSLQFDSREDAEDNYNAVFKS